MTVKRSPLTGKSKVYVPFVKTEEKWLSSRWFKNLYSLFGVKKHIFYINLFGKISLNREKT